MVAIHLLHAGRASPARCLLVPIPMDCSPPGSSIHGIFQARVLEWGAITYSKQYFNPITTLGVGQEEQYFSCDSSFFTLTVAEFLQMYQMCVSFFSLKEEDLKQLSVCNSRFLVLAVVWEKVLGICVLIRQGTL